MGTATDKACLTSLTRITSLELDDTGDDGQLEADPSDGIIGPPDQPDVEGMQLKVKTYTDMREEVLDEPQPIDN